MRRRVRLPLVLCVALLAAWWLSGLAVTSRLTDRARPAFPEPPPLVAWGAIEEHRLDTSDGHEVGAWLIEGEPDRAAVLLLHGNGGSRSAMLPRLRVLAERGHTVLAPSLRAHGDSSGERNDIGFGARLDVVAALELLHERAPGAPIVCVGRSLGGAAAVFAASEPGGLAEGYALECVYADLGTAALNRIRWFLPAPLDHVAWGAMRSAAPLLIDVQASSPVRAIASIPTEVPVLILAGSEDRHASLDEARALLDGCGAQARLVVFEGAGHDRLAEDDPEAYWRELDGLLERVLGR